MKRSDSINEIAAAMAKAQTGIRNAAMDKTNPAFRSKYADLASVWAACRDALSANGLAIFQTPAADGPKVTVTTLLAHTSGQWVEGELVVTAEKATPQGIGSAITYARRYGLSALVGVAPGDDIADTGDDDGEAAEGRGEPPKTTAEKVKEKVATKAPPIDAYKAEALKEAIALHNGNIEEAKRWLCQVRADPGAKRPWNEADVEKVKQALVLKRAKSNVEAAIDEFGLN